MTALHVSRLEKLSSALRTGVGLSGDGFDFSEYLQRRTCGTLRCAIGELPAVFGAESPVTDDELANRFYDGDGAVAKFFGLERREYAHLFLPSCQYPKEYGGEFLGNDSTREEVADGIDAFLAIKAKVNP